MTKIKKDFQFATQWSLGNKILPIVC